MEFSLKCAALFQLTTLAPDNAKQLQEVGEKRAQFMGGLVVDNYKVARISIGRRELKYKRLEVLDRLYLGYPKNKIVLFQTYERCNEFIQYLFKYPTIYHLLFDPTFSCHPFSIPISALLQSYYYLLSWNSYY